MAQGNSGNQKPKAKDLEAEQLEAGRRDSHGEQLEVGRRDSHREQLEAGRRDKKLTKAFEQNR